MDAKSIWGKWDPSLHCDEYGKKRIASARSSKLTPIKIDFNDSYGYFQGSHGRYETFLDTCPCGDFRRAKRPCKHMYRLAAELGLMDFSFDSNQDAIPPVRIAQGVFSDCVDLIESLSESAQLFLLDTIRNMSSSSPQKVVRVCSELAETESVGLLKRSSDIEYVFKTKHELIELFSQCGIAAPKCKFDELKSVCISNYPQVSDLLEKRVAVTFTSSYSRRKAHYYLHRKFDSLCVYNDDGSYIDIPLLETILPDDEVTHELKRHGYGDKMGASGFSSDGAMAGL